MSMSFMFSHGYWIRSFFGNKLGRMLLGFVQAYGVCAKQCLREGKNRYAIIPKLHMVHHAGIRLILDSMRSQWVISPLATSAQQQEDYIGKPARISRRVHAGSLLHKRVCDRALIASMFALAASDNDDRGM